MTTQPILSRLKALQPSPRQRRVPLATEASDATRGLSPDIPAGAGRLAEILGASPRRNRFGEHLGLRRWFSEAVGDGLALNAPEQEIDPAALSLLAPGAPKEVRDPSQWLFLDTETTGLAGALAPTRSSSASPGGTRAALKSNSFSCASKARSIPC